MSGGIPFRTNISVTGESKKMGRKSSVLMVIGKDGQARYKCPHPDCDKSFTRQEHLSRHKLNHWPKEIYTCNFVYLDTHERCGKTFVRRDLLNRHEKRHETKQYSTSKSRSKSRETTPATPTVGIESVLSNNTNNYMMSKFPISSNEQHTPRKRPKLKSVESSTSNVFYNSSEQKTPKTEDSIYSQVNGQQHENNLKPNDANVKNMFNFIFNGKVNVLDPLLKKENVTVRSSPTHTTQKTFQVPNPLVYPENQTATTNDTNALGYNADIFNYGTNATDNDKVKDSHQMPIDPSFNSNPNKNLQDIPPKDNVVRTAGTGIKDNNISSDTTNKNQEVFDWSSVMADREDPYQSISTSNSSANLNKVYDLFSIDFLNDDPLQNFMQELSVGHNNILNSTTTSAPSTHPNNSPIQESTCSSSGMRKSEDLHLQASAKYDDSQKSQIKDNLTRQKNNIDNFIKKDKEQRRPKDYENKNHKQKQRKNMKNSMKEIPSFFYVDQSTKYDISKDKCLELYNLVPELGYLPVVELKRALQSFWCNFHPQYGLLHKPSFNVNETPAILILAIIMTGASFLGSNARETVSDPICGPLRWIIFSHPDFQPPSQTYIIQSLLLLEGYEKACTNRYLHERSFLHHGTTIQLLRRTPSLGGHPSIVKREGTITAAEVIATENGQRDALEEIYKQWIDFEMLKRIAFYAFYMDTTHAVVFGYWNLFIHCNQIQLNLPCSDEIWESYDLSYNTLLNNGFGATANMKDYRFLPTLKGLMNEVTDNLRKLKLNRSPGSFNIGSKEPLRNDNNRKKWDIRSIFGKKLLLAGIISIMFQCQETILPTSFRVGYENGEVLSWTDIISFAVNYWLLNIQGNCTDTNLCMVPSNKDANLLTNSNSEEDIDKSRMNVDLLGNEDNTLCKIPVYHVVQIVLRIFHNDYYIFAGAPWRMNVRLDKDEYKVVSNRVLKFAQNPYNGGVAIIHAFQFLFQMFLNVEKTSNGQEKITFKDYDINSDFIITRPNTVALTSVLIWCYNYVLYGSESRLWDNSGESLEDEGKGKQIAEENQRLKEDYKPKESFEDYLVRMYQSIHINTNVDVVTYQAEIWNKATQLQTIPNMNNMCGMMQYMSAVYKKSYWDLGREFGNLFDNCFERSIGKDSPTCFNMYDV
ncbi:Sdd4p RNJ42_04960 [Nakaseomyces bracarensis]|uniref:Sdd4p n=1 Tax=Nakaseomyces bracarensis TaxID=273131 RepID=UPI0038722203